MKKKHGIFWWIFIGWWWYLCFAWWLYPIKRLLFRKKSSGDADNSLRLIRETETAVISALENSEGRTGLRTNIKNGLSGKLKPYFEEAVNNLYQNGKIKTSKVSGRVLLELV